MYNTLTCLFGHHQYSEELTEDKDGVYIYLCKVCKRSAYSEDTLDESTFIITYDENGNMVHTKFDDGYEVWCDKKGNKIREKGYWAGGRG